MKCFAPLFLALLLHAFVSRGFALEAQARSEIEYLIRAVETSDARFIRNGKEYSPNEGAAHLRNKWNAAGDRIKTADDFVRGAATKSILSGKPYMMKTREGKLLPVAQWLEEKLRRYRAARSETQ